MARKAPSYGRDQEYVPQYPTQVRRAPQSASGPLMPKRPSKPEEEPVRPLLGRDLGDEGRRLQAYVEGRLDGSLKRKPGKQASKLFTPAVTFMAASVLVLVLLVGGALLLAAGVQQPAPQSPDTVSSTPTVPVAPAGTVPASDEDVVQVEDDVQTRSGGSRGNGSLSPEQAEAAREKAVPPASSEAPPQ